MLVFVLSITLLVGCGNPVGEDLENFINYEMSEINENYYSIKTEAANWSNLTDAADVEASITDVLLPLISDTLDKLDNVNPETDEVKALKDKYVEMMETYNEGFSEFLDGIYEGDADKMASGQGKITAGQELHKEYNAAVDDLAAQTGYKAEN